MLSTLANILAIRFKGIDPDRLLNWLYPCIRWMYSPVAVAGCMLLALSALVAGRGAIRRVPVASCPRSTSSSRPAIGSGWASCWG